MKGIQTYFDTRKSEVEELRGLLQDRTVQRDRERYRGVVQRVIAFMTSGIDVSSLFKDMIMASAASSDLVQKKLVYLYICTHAESNSELALLTVNTLQKDAADENAMVRGLALRSMLSLRIPSLVEYMKMPLLNGLKDKSAYVRKTAVVGTLKMFYMCPEVIEELDVINKLHSMIRDYDSQVSFNCILALDEMEASKGGISLSKELVGYLLDRLHGFNEWCQCMLMEILARYQPENQDDVFDIMNNLDDRLNHSNKAVVMAAAKLFLMYASQVQHIAMQIYGRLRGPLLTLMFARAPELIFSGLNHIQKIVQVNPSLFSKDYKSFFLSYLFTKLFEIESGVELSYYISPITLQREDTPMQSEPVYVKEQKLDVLTYIVTDRNMEAIIDELKVYVCDPDVTMSKRAIQCIGTIAVEHHGALSLCLRTLVDLISLDVDYLTSNVMEQMGRLLMKYGDMHHTIIPHVEGCFDLVADHPKGKASLIWILGQYGEHIPCSPYLLEEVIDNVTAEQSSNVKSQLLTATMKLYFKRPPECQRMLVKLLKAIIDEEENMDVRDRALFYFRLLKHDLNLAREVVLTDHVDDDTVAGRSKEPGAMNYKEFNTLSTIYGIPPEQFISPCTPYMLEGAVRPMLSLAKTQAEPQGFGHPLASQKQGHRQENTLPSYSPAAVVVGDLLGGLSVHDGKEPNIPTIKLVQDFTILPAEYEKAWTAIKSQALFDRSLTVVPQKDELEMVMASHNIITMASSPPENPVVKFFYFCKEVSSGELILTELNIYKELSKMDGVIKCKSSHVLEIYSVFFQDLFIGKWIAAS